MSVPPHQPALLVSSILGRTLTSVDAAVNRFASQYGVLSFISEPLDFNWTQYYRDELGDHPARRIIAIDRLIDAAALTDIKRASNRLEIALARPGFSRVREVNIDPGCLGTTQLILASTKATGHRIHLGKGIFAELTLLYGPDGFMTLPWTYPDYATQELRDLFNRLRIRLLELLKIEEARKT